MAGAGADPPRGGTSGADVAGIRVARPVSQELRRLRGEDPVISRAVDAAIKRIPSGEGMPLKLDVPGAPTGRHYWAIIPDMPHAPVVCYRPMEPGDHADGQWLVTALIPGDQFSEYLKAERRGILDDPAVRTFANTVAGTVSSILAEAPPGRIGTGDD